eukprot:GDKH01020249.1.p1 GENE.GDKH01020249.1~~GDKH01020249.1.p1  ORF type:complete len:116 (-),score=4.66 GDKH01020249.1:61-408(-)
MHGDATGSMFGLFVAKRSKCFGLRMAKKCTVGRGWRSAKALDESWWHPLCRSFGVGSSVPLRTKVNKCKNVGATRRHLCMLCGIHKGAAVDVVVSGILGGYTTALPLPLHIYMDG